MRRNAIGIVLLGCLLAFTACGGGGGGGGDQATPTPTPTPTPAPTSLYEFGPGRYVQYRAYPNVDPNSVLVWLPMTVDDAPVEEGDISEVRILNSSDETMNAAYSGFETIHTVFASCLSDPCSSTEILINGVWRSFTTLPSDTYTFEVDTVDGQTLTTTMDYPGDLLMPYIEHPTMQGEWSGGDLALSWTNPTGDANWAEVDELWIIVYDMADNEVLYCRVNPADQQVTIPQSIMDQTDSISSGGLKFWRVLTLALDDDGLNTARGYSNGINMPSP